MSKQRPTIGTDGLALPVMPPEHDGRVWAKQVRVMFYTPGFLALLLIKAAESTSFGITVELLMLASASAIVAGLFIGTQSEGGGADHSSRVGTARGALVPELLCAVPFMTAVPSLFHQLAGFGTLHFVVSKAVNWALNIAIFGLIVASYTANRMSDFQAERVLTGVLVVIVAVTTIYGILKLRAMQVAYDAHVPVKEKDKDK